MHGSDPSASTGSAPSRLAPLRLASSAMGTRFELILPEVPCKDASRARLRAAGEAALDELRAVDARWSLFRRDSFLSFLVRTAADTPVRLDEDDFELLATAQRVFELSGGAFDPCVAPALAARGFPRPTETREARRGRFSAVELDSATRTVRLREAGIGIDLGGIAKGHGLDRALRVLVECGVRAAFLHGGTSSVLALGAPPGAAAWRVRLGAEPSAPVAALRDAALAVSAQAGQRDARERGHVLDPRTCSDVDHAGDRVPTGAGTSAPVASAITLALESQQAPSAIADALSTATLVLGTPVAPSALPHVTQLIATHPARWQIVAGPTAPIEPGTSRAMTLA